MIIMNELQLLNVLFGIGASLATIGGFVAKKGKAGSLKWLSDRFGVDLYDLSGGLDETLAREPPAQVLGAVDGLANESHSSLYPSDLVTLASNNTTSSVLIERALMGEDVDRAELLGEHLSDDELKSLLDGRDIWPDPINQIAQLEDDPSRAYAWILSDDATAEDRVSLSQEIEHTFIDMKHSEPESMHFVVSSIDEIAELDSETVRQYVKPWLNAEEN